MPVVPLPERAGKRKTTVEFEVIVVSQSGPDNVKPLMRRSYCSLRDALELKRAYEDLGLTACINPMTVHHGAA